MPGALRVYRGPGSTALLSTLDPITNPVLASSSASSSSWALGLKARVAGAARVSGSRTSWGMVV